MGVILFCVPLAHANRLFTSGFEFGTSAEWEANAGNVVYLSTVARTGNFGLSVYNNVRSGVIIGYNTAVVDTPTFTRFYFNVSALPAAGMGIWAPQNGFAISSTVSTICELMPNGTFQFFTSAGVALGATSLATAIGTGSWHRLEFHHDFSKGSGHQVLEMEIDGVTAMSYSTFTALTTADAVRIGSNLFGGGAQPGNIYIDDFALNDTSGAVQNSWPGDGNVRNLVPTANGDTSASIGLGGTSPAATAWQSVNEIPPDDAVTVATMTAATSIMDFTMTPIANVGIHTYDSINAVNIGWRGRGGTAASCAWAPGFKDSTLGPVSTGTITTIASASFGTNDDTAGAHLYKIFQSTDPVTGNTLTPTNVNNMQARIFTSTIGQTVWTSGVWAVVDYSAGVAPASNVVMPSMGLMGVGGQL